jgi:cytochrome c oxidase subunit III
VSTTGHPDAGATAAAPHAHRDDVGSRMGMWLFLFTELILFGGMFIVYAVYRFQHPQEFHVAARELDTFVGTVNTLILLTSSLTVALAIAVLRQGKKNLALLFVGMTVLLAGGFLANKVVEWGHKFSVGTYPGAPELLSQPQGVILYFGLYFVMTGLHALHVIIGMVILLVMMRMIASGRIHAGSLVRLESGGLYWHLVDIIWIFLFPLFYLLH